MNILAIDDEQTDLELLGVAIAQAELDARLFTVPNGQEGIRYLEGVGMYADRSTHPLPDTIVLDLKMWGMDGFQFLEWRKSSNWSALPVVVLTNSPNEDHIQRALHSGANLVFTKPLELDRLTAVARRIVDFGRKSAGL